MTDGFFDRDAIVAGRGRGRRRRTMLFLVESFSNPDGPDAGAALDFLASTEIFGGLDRETLRGLLPHLEPVHVGAGESVAPGDTLLLVGHGRVTVVGADGSTTERGPGQVVDAAALLGGPGEGVQVEAVRDSMLLTLSADAFEAFAHRHPAALLGLCRQLVRLSTRPAEAVAVPQATNTVAVLPAGRAPVPGFFVPALAEALAAHGSVAVLSRDTVGPEAADVDPADPRNGAVVARLQQAEQRNRFVVYVADPHDSAWTRRCVRQADRVLLVARSGTDPLPGPADPRRSADLVLLHPAGTEKPVGTPRWLTGRDVDLHHHLREGRAADLARLARHIAGTARGLVLGGGGMRGFAHLGVMRAFDDAGVDVDAVAGTSIGAIMAGLRAGGLDHAGRLETSVNAMVRQGSMVPATLPLVSYSSARKVTRLLHDVPVFRWDIEDLWLPFFCISASLGHAREVVHDRGPAWRAIRASISLPGVYPPVPHDGDLLVDGGVLNNVPVDVMTARLRGGRVVAVDLAPEEASGPPAVFGETLSGWRVLGARVRRRAPLHAPALPDVLVRGLMLASSRGDRARLADSAGTIVLRPPLGTGGLLDFKNGPALIDPAYRYTRDVLPTLNL
ncbi:cyclic nucleotide-binding and patatin-like phospholipase domain-containing protein [Pseudonocardia sp. N23]|uniref:cyclic nucleotide-binding and patatin-like phospholipase domain-containing protein n=1 Tax=Pseudonocardia sp. N23 TaxID=1987376 RepID=UPI000BFC3FFC|nr:cyclic nucleotide-binding and patatin-like phospholipase domain-containing protein [Pseudonocardia sp. N23]GAY10278.1 patatin [Pseudonocardia sp. N23]